MLFVTLYSRYRWAFVGDPGNEEVEPRDKKRGIFQEQPGFVPHIVRIDRLMTLRVCKTNSNEPNIKLLPHLYSSGQPGLTYRL